MHHYPRLPSEHNLEESPCYNLEAGKRIPGYKHCFFISFSIKLNKSTYLLDYVRAYMNARYCKSSIISSYLKSSTMEIVNIAHDEKGISSFTLHRPEGEERFCNVQKLVCK